MAIDKRFNDLFDNPANSKKDYLHFWSAKMLSCNIMTSGGATPGRARSNDLAGRSTALASPRLLLCFGNSVNRKFKKCYHI